MNSDYAFAVKVSNHLPFLVVVGDDVDVVFDNVVRGGIGSDPEPSFTARLSNLIDSVVAINNTFCAKRKEREKKIHRLNYCFKNRK